MNLSKNLFFHSSAQVLSRLISAATTLVLTFLITQNLSQNAWGDFVTITSYVALFWVIADFGLNAVVIKQMVGDEAKEKEYFRQLLGLRIALSFVGIFLALAILTFLPHSAVVKLGIILGSFLILTQSLYTTAAAAFQTKTRYEQLVFAEIVGNVTTLMLVFLAVSLNAGLIVIIAVYVLGSLVRGLVGLFLAGKLFKTSGFGINLSLWKVFMLASLPLGLTVVLSQVNANIDKQIIALNNSSAVNGAIAVGIYGLAYRFFDFAISLPTFIVNTVYPSMITTFREEKEDFSRKAKNLSLTLFAVGFLGTVVGYFAAPIVVSFFGDYEEAVLTLRILLLGLPFFFVSSFFFWTVITLNKEIFLPFIYGFAVLVNVVLNMIFVPLYGYNASAWITLITELVILIPLFWLIETDLDILPRKKHE